MKIGDKLICSNKHTYTLGKGDGFYTFSLIDEFGELINMAHDYYIKECIYPSDTPLCIGKDFYNHLKYTDVLKLIEI